MTGWYYTVDFKSSFWMVDIDFHINFYWYFISFISVIKYTLKAFSGTWVVRFGRFSFTLLFRGGRVTLNGRTIKVTPSKGNRYPFTQGWFIYYYKDWTYYLRMSGRRRISIIRMNRIGNVFKGKRIFANYDWRQYQRDLWF